MDRRVGGQGEDIDSLGPVIRGVGEALGDRGLGDDPPDDDLHLGGLVGRAVGSAVVGSQEQRPVADLVRTELSLIELLGGPDGRRRDHDGDGDGDGGTGSSHG